MVTASAPRPSALRIGISACLLGEEVRFDGGHKKDAFLTGVLAPHVEWVAVCPEVEVGMGTPREPIHLVDEQGVIRLRGVSTGVDHTAAMTAYAARRVAALADDDLSGYVLKSASPSCGPTGVNVQQTGGSTSSDGVGVFARALLARFPDLPIVDEHQLADEKVRAAFLARVFAYRKSKA